MTARNTVIVLAFAFCMSGCRGSGSSILTRMYFGMSSHGTEIPAAQWNGFVDSVVTPVFPDGFTVYAAQGQWRGSGGAVEKQPCMVLEIVHSPSAENNRKILLIAETYKSRFDQESVLILRQAAQAEF